MKTEAIVEEKKVPMLAGDNQVTDLTPEEQAKKLLGSDTGKNTLPKMKAGFTCYWVPVDSIGYLRAIEKGIHVCTRGDGSCIDEDMFPSDSEGRLLRGKDTYVGCISIEVIGLRNKLMAKSSRTSVTALGGVLIEKTIEID